MRSTGKKSNANVGMFTAWQYCNASGFVHFDYMIPSDNWTSPLGLKWVLKTVQSQEASTAAKFADQILFKTKQIAH